MSTAKMVFHGSDIEKICEVYQLKSEEIVKFGANVNPLGLSEHVKEQLAGRLDILSLSLIHICQYTVIPDSARCFLRFQKGAGLR